MSEPHPPPRAPVEEKQEEKPQKILIELTIPTKESIVEGIKAQFPTVQVKVIEEETKE